LGGEATQFSISFPNKFCRATASRFELNRTNDEIEIFVHLAIMQKFIIFNDDYTF